MKCAVRGTRSRWVGPPVSAPKRELSRSPRGRQTHYGAVELAGAGNQVNVNDVVEVAENKQQQETSQQHPVLVQVLSLWEDKFTGVFLFRARWLVQASDLPADALSRLRTGQQAAAADRGATRRDTLMGNEQDGDEEVFLTNRVKDLEVRSILKPITLCVSTNGATAVSPERKYKMGPRLTHAFCNASGAFHLLGGTNPIIRRAEVRHANAVALASKADQEHGAAESGKPLVKSNGWLLPKRRVFERRGGQTAARGRGSQVEIAAAPFNSTGSHVNSSSLSVDIEDESDRCGTEAPRNSEDGELKEIDEGKDKDKDPTDSASDSLIRSEPILFVGEVFTPRKSPRKRKSQLSPTPDCKVDDNSKAKPKARLCPPATTSAPKFQRRCRVPFKKLQGPLHPRHRRLAMPPMAEKPVLGHVGDTPTLASAKASMSVKAGRPLRTRISLESRPPSSAPLPRSSSMEDLGEASPHTLISSKRKRSVTNKTTQGASRSDQPSLRALVGKDYQTDIPHLLSADERKQPHTGTGAKMVWRSVQDWDPQSRAMLDNYLHAAKGVVEAKQARPGVAVHVRLGGKNGGSDTDKDNNTDVAGSYAVWAISSGREACGLIRVGCSEVAQTDIPRSAIQRVQSQEQALSALVKARCVLDHFQPALQVLAGDQGSPESIEPWTLQQVRTLEKALENDYDPNRRLHGWARPGMEMDREDFIDLATVSKKVPGKTSAQVLSFYYRYLAAAEPLTDLVYGPEAAKARTQEPMSPVSSTPEADATHPSNGDSTRGCANTTNPKRPVKQGSPVLSNTRADHSSSQPIASAPKPKPRCIRLSAPKPAKVDVAITRPNVGRTVNTVLKDASPTKKVSPPPAYDAVWPARETTPTCHSPDVSKLESNKGTPGDDEHPAQAERGTGRGLGNYECVRGRSFDRQGGRGRGLNGASEYSSRQRRCAVREREVTRTIPALPPGAEVLEVEDSDDAEWVSAGRHSTVSAQGDGEPAQPSNVDAAARHIASTDPSGFSWVSGQKPWRAPQPAALGSRPSGVLPLVPRSSSRDIYRKEGHRVRSFDARGAIYRGEAPCFASAQREPRWETPPPSHPIRQGDQSERPHNRPNSGQIEQGGHPSSDCIGRGFPREGSVHVGSEPVSVDDTFEFMAPCWRLLQRAQAYMDNDQLEYMKGLILTHVRKPMSRDQLLERAQSCLQEQDGIFAAFVRMFDHIDQPPQLPLYPAKRATHPRSRWMSYEMGRSPEVTPINDSPYVLPLPQVPPSVTSNVQRGDILGSHLISDRGEKRITTSTPSQPYPRLRVPASRRVEVRRSIHPYDHNGAYRWRAIGAGGIGRNDSVGIRADPPAHRLSPRRQPSDACLHRARCPERLPDKCNDERERPLNAWSQQPAGEWEPDIVSSAANAAANVNESTRGMIGRRSTGPAWGLAGGYMRS